MLITKLNIDTISTATCFHGVPAIHITTSCLGTSDNVFDPKLLKAKGIKLSAYIGSIVEGKVSLPLLVEDRYFDEFFYAIGRYVKTNEYSMNHVVIYDKDCYADKNYWKMLYSLSYTTTMRVQLVITKMPKIDKKLLFTINSSTPKVWLTVVCDVNNPETLDARFLTKANEMVVPLNDEDSADNFRVFMARNQNLPFPVFVTTKNDNMRHTCRKLSFGLNVRYVNKVMTNE